MFEEHQQGAFRYLKELNGIISCPRGLSTIGKPKLCARNCRRSYVSTEMPMDLKAFFWKTNLLSPMR